MPSDAGAIIRFNLALARETEARELVEPTLRAGVRAFLAQPEYGRYYLAFGDPLEEVPNEAGIPNEASAREEAVPRGETDPDPIAEGAPIGQIMVTFEFSDWRNGPIWWIQSVYVAPGHRRRGIYQALHDHVRRAAREAGAAGLRLYVDRENRVAKATYRSLGMEPSRYDMYEEIWG